MADRKTVDDFGFNLEAAFANVRAEDVKQIWVPDVLRHGDYLLEPELVLVEARRRIDSRSFGAATPVLEDKTRLLHRRGLLLDLPDMVAYQAIVSSFAQLVEDKTLDAVFSARLEDRDGSEFFTKRGAWQWMAWRKHLLGQLEAGGEFVVETDLTAFFDCIRHELLTAELKSLGVGQDVHRLLKTMLDTWGRVKSLGLPQMPNASRLLANLYLLPVDAQMVGAGWRYSRFLDDVKIVVESESEAVAAVAQFQTLCAERGLIVSSGKTAVIAREPAIEHLSEHPEFALAEYLVQSNEPGPARDTLRKIFAEAVPEDGPIDKRKLKFSLYRLGLLRDSTILPTVTSRLADLGPAASVVSSYLAGHIEAHGVESSLAGFLADGDRSRSQHLTSWVFAAMAERSGPIPDEWIHQARRRLDDRNGPPYLRSVAAVIVLRGGDAADIRNAKREISTEPNDMVVRGYAVGLHWVNELTKPVCEALVARGLGSTRTYLQGRGSLPSMIGGVRLIDVRPVLPELVDAAGGE